VFDRFLSWIHRTVVSRPRTIIVVFSVLTGLALIGAAQVEVQSNSVKMFRKRVPLRQDYEYVDEKMGGSMSVEIMLDTGESSGVTDPDFLARMDKLERFVKAHPLTTTTTSILDILRQTRRAFNENRPEYYSIPESREEASQYLLIYEMSGGANKEKYVTYDYDVARLTARTRSMDSKDVGKFLDEVGAFAEQTFAGSDVEIGFTGLLAWVKVMTDHIGDGQKISFLTAATIITLIMMVVLRSVRLGLISMIPNVFPVLMTLGLMGLAGVYMDIGMMSIGAIILGVAVDDTIHFFVRFRREFELVRNYGDALEATISSVGRPITFTTVTLTLGFSALLLSDVMGMVKFGGFAGYAFVWALLADLLFAPALLIVLQPLGRER
jgi:predicted RND superfamily exporter protein